MRKDEGGLGRRCGEQMFDEAESKATWGMDLFLKQAVRAGLDRGRFGEWKLYRMESTQFV